MYTSGLRRSDVEYMVTVGGLFRSRKEHECRGRAMSYPTRWRRETWAWARSPSRYSWSDLFPRGGRGCGEGSWETWMLFGQFDGLNPEDILFVPGAGADDRADHRREPRYARTHRVAVLTRAHRAQASPASARVARLAGRLTRTNLIPVERLAVNL